MATSLTLINKFEINETDDIRSDFSLGIYKCIAMYVIAAVHSVPIV